MKALIILVIILVQLNKINAKMFPNVYPTLQEYPLPTGADPGNILYLTPLIESGKIDQARNMSFCDFPGFKNISSYTGYFTVDKSHGSNMFFWFFPSVQDYKNDPVVLWLQGGPGASSLIGLFGENGPFQPKAKHGLKVRKYFWSLNHNVIYIDNPVGTGYSFTKDGYAKDQVKVGADLYEALSQFFTMFPELRQNQFYVTGESYAGKYVPAISYTIHKNNPTAKEKINFQGMAIGNGLSDPEHQLKYGDYLYQLGLVDGNTRKFIQSKEAEGVKYIQNKQFAEAFKLFDELLNGDMNNHNSIFKNVTGFDNYFNYLVANDTSETLNYMNEYIQKPEIRKAIHVGNATFNTENQVVEVNLMQDVMQSVTGWISELLSHYRVMFYNGQLDIIVAYPLTVNMLDNLKFSASEEYKSAERKIWTVGEDIAGYVKRAGNLTEVLVRNAGHMVPGDQPKWGWDLITRFTRNKKFD